MARGAGVGHGTGLRTLALLCHFENAPPARHLGERLVSPPSTVHVPAGPRERGLAGPERGPSLGAGPCCRRAWEGRGCSPESGETAGFRSKVTPASSTLPPRLTAIGPASCSQAPPSCPVLRPLGTRVCLLGEDPQMPLRSGWSPAHVHGLSFPFWVFTAQLCPVLLHRTSLFCTEPCSLSPHCGQGTKGSGLSHC